MRDFAIAGVLFVVALGYLGFSTVTGRTRRLAGGIAQRDAEDLAGAATTSRALAAYADASGWRPLDRLALDPAAGELVVTALRALGHVEEDIFQQHRFVDAPTWSSIYAVDERSVIASAAMVSRRTDGSRFTGPGVVHPGSVAVVELPSPRAPLLVLAHPMVSRMGTLGPLARTGPRTGDGEFDRRFAVLGEGTVGRDARARVDAREDWCFLVLGTQAVCVSAQSLDDEVQPLAMLAALRALTEQL